MDTISILLAIGTIFILTLALTALVGIVGWNLLEKINTLTTKITAIESVVNDLSTEVNEELNSDPTHSAYTGSTLDEVFFKMFNDPHLSKEKKEQLKNMFDQLGTNKEEDDDSSWPK